MQPSPLPPVPEETATVAQAAFRRPPACVRLRDELGVLYEDADFAALFPVRGRRALPPWRLALVTVLQFLEGLSDRQAADAVRARIDWKYALSLELGDPGFDYSVLSEFRGRLAAGGHELLLLDRMLECFAARGLLKARGRQRTDSTHVLSAVRAMNRLSSVDIIVRSSCRLMRERCRREGVMAHVGLVRFAQVAHAVAHAVLPNYRTPKSKHTFTQPPLLAVLCLMRFDDWGWRDAEVRLAEHRELRRVLGFRHRVPDYSTLCKFAHRLEPVVLEAALAETVRRFGPPTGPHGRGTRALTLVADATGLATSSVSTYFVRREYEIKGQVRERAAWLKWLVLVDVTRQLILAQRAHRGPVSDSRLLPQLLAAAPLRDAAFGPAGLPVSWGLADAEFDAERNPEFIHTILGARSAIPATTTRRGALPRTPHRRRMAQAFPERAYHRRVLGETTFSTAKRVMGGVAPGRREDTQILQALLVGLAFNIRRLHHAA